MTLQSRHGNVMKLANPLRVTAFSQPATTQHKVVFYQNFVHYRNVILPDQKLQSQLFSLWQCVKNPDYKKKLILVGESFKTGLIFTREDWTIESVVPLPAPFAGDSSGSTPFTPWPIHWCPSPGMPPESSQSLPSSPSTEKGVKRGCPLFTPWPNFPVCPRPPPLYYKSFFSGIPGNHWFIFSSFAIQWVQIISEGAFSYS